MKKVLFLILICCLVFCVGCNDKSPNNNENPPIDTNRLKTVEEIMSAASPNDLSCSKYQLKKYAAPYWSNQIIYNETVMFVTNSDGTIPVKKLAFKIAKVLEVRNSTLETLYTEGEDYIVTADGELKLLQNTKATVTAYGDYYLTTDKVNGIGALSKKETGKFLDYGEGAYFYNKQLCVTYIRTEKYEGVKPVFNSEGLPKTIEKLKNKENFNVVFYGDSIVTGCNSSGNYNAKPNMPLFSTMVIDKLKDYFSYDSTNITNINTAVGGWLSENGKGELTKRVLDKNPDLVIIGFGMNDGTWGVNAETFGGNIDFMVKRIQQKNPNCEVLLLSTMLPNPDATTADNGDYLKKQGDYVSVLTDIAEGYAGVELANITQMHSELLRRKDYFDMTGNNINHPSDFLVRVYSQVILSHLIENF